MRLLDRIKGLLGEKEAEHVTLALEEAPGWIETERAAIKEREAALRDQLEQERAGLITDLEEQEPVLAAIDVDAIKVEKRYKAIMKGNLAKYRDHLGQLIQHLRALEEEEVGDYIEELQRLLAEHHQRSEKHFQKATISIGKELAATKERIITFSRSLKRLMERNKGVLERSRQLARAGERMAAYEERGAEREKLQEEASQTKERIAAAAKREEQLAAEIERIKKGEAYAKAEEAAAEQRRAARDITKETQQAKQLVDFKALGNVFHSSPQQMAAIKAYKESFAEELERDGGRRLLELVEEARLESAELRQSLATVAKLRKKLDAQPSTKDPTREAKRKEAAAKEELAALRKEESRQEQRARKAEEAEAAALEALRKSLTRLKANLE